MIADQYLHQESYKLKQWGSKEGILFNCVRDYYSNVILKNISPEILFLFYYFASSESLPPRKNKGIWFAAIISVLI